MCHTVTGLPHLKVEDIILLHLVRMPLAQLVNCEAPPSNCVSIGAQSLSVDSICDHLSLNS